MKEHQDLNEEQKNISNEMLADTQEQIEEKTENLAQKHSVEELLTQEKDRYIRLFAEFENYKKRSAKERIDFVQFANKDLMTSMLDVLDDFERALKEISKTGNEGELKGVELIYQKFKHKLNEKGLKPIETKTGDDFNVDFHEAITQIPAPTEELKGKVVDVIETGYQLYEHIIRFTKVVTGK